MRFSATANAVIAGLFTRSSDDRTQRTRMIAATMSGVAHDASSIGRVCGLSSGENTGAGYYECSGLL